MSERVVSSAADVPDDLEKRQLLAELQAKMFRRGQPVRLGRYVLVQRLGSGAMGVVYRAEDPQLRRQVAVKVLHPDRQEVDADVGHARLRREAQALGRVRHPNVIEVYDVGTVGERLFIAMELVEGRSLEGWLAAQPRPWAAVLEVFVQAGWGLAAAHEAGVVHRDFKPSNVQVGNDGSVRVLDFGLARATRSVNTNETATNVSHGGGGTVTVDGAVIGTPRYMAPAQLRGAPADFRSDQYAFCVALWEALFDHPPFDPDRMLQTKQTAERVHLRRSSAIPLRIQRSLRRGLSPDPSNRFGSMRELLESLEPRSNRSRWVMAGLLGTFGVVIAATWPTAGDRPPIAHADLSPTPADGPPDEAEAALRSQLENVQALYRAQSLEEADAASKEVLQRATESGDAGLRAEAGLLRGRILADRDRGDEALRALEAAHADAVAVRDDRVRFNAAITLARLQIQTRHDLEQGKLWMADARTVLEASEADAKRRFSLSQLEVVLAREEGDEPTALAAAREAVALTRQPWAEGGSQRPYALQTLGVVAFEQQRLDEARQALEEALDQAETNLGPDHVLIPQCQSVLAGVDAMDASEGDDPSRFARAIESARRAAAAFERVYGPDHFDTINARLNLGIILAEARELEQARDELRYAMAGLERLRGPDERGIFVAAESLGTVLADLGQLDEAEASLQRALIGLQGLRGDEHPSLVAILLYLGDVQQRRGRIEQARRTYQRALDLAKKAAPASVAAAQHSLSQLEL